MPHSSLSRRSSQTSSSPATGSSCEVGSSSSDEGGAAGDRRGEGDALKLAAGELVRRAVEQLGDPERERGLLDPARHRGGPEAAVLQREGDLRADRAHHDLRLGLLEQRAADRGQVAGPVLARVEAADDDAPGGLAAVEVRHETACRADQRRLAGRREPRQDDELAGIDVQRYVAQRRLGTARIAVPELLEGQRAHGSIPRLLANGSSASATIADA